LGKDRTGRFLRFMDEYQQGAAAGSVSPYANVQPDPAAGLHEFATGGAVRPYDDDADTFSPDPLVSHETDALEMLTPDQRRQLNDYVRIRQGFGHTYEDIMRDILNSMQGLGVGPDEEEIEIEDDEGDNSETP